MKVRHCCSLLFITLCANAYSSEWYEILDVKPHASPQEILGLPVNADADAIHAAFKKLSLKYHPDKWEPHNQLGPCRPTDISQDEAQEVMKILSNAKDTFSTATQATPSSGGWSKNKSDYTFKFKECGDEFYWSEMTFKSEMARQKLSPIEREAQLYAMTAAKLDDIEALKYAIANRFDVNTRNAFFEGQYLESVIRMYKRGADTAFLEFLLNQKMAPGDNASAMQLAVERGLLNIVKMLYAKGLSTEGFSGNHHLTVNVGDIAKQYHHNDIVEWYESIKKQR